MNYVSVYDRYLPLDRHILLFFSNSYFMRFVKKNNNNLDALVSIYSTDGRLQIMLILFELFVFKVILTK